MKNNLILAALVSAGLTLSTIAQAEEREHEEQTINSRDVPQAVQQAAQAEAKGRTTPAPIDLIARLP